MHGSLAKQQPGCECEYLKTPSPDGQTEPVPCLFPQQNDGGCGEEAETKVCEVDIEEMEKVTVFCMNTKTTIYSFFTAVWSIILHQFVELDNLYFGVNLNSTDAMEYDGADTLIGNMQVIAVTVNRETVVEKLFRAKSYRVHPLRCYYHANFNTVVKFITRYAVDNPEAGTITSNDTSTLDPGVMLIVRSSSEKPALLLQYRTSTISDWQARNLAGTIAQVVEDILVNPEQPVKNVTLFSRQNGRDVARWNDKDWSEEPSDHSITDIISRQCLLQPTAQAVCSWDGDLTYSELHDLSSRLAVHLKSLGVDCELMVPLCFDKSLWAIVAMLAVLKAGSAFIPIDPAHPLRRQKEITRQVNASVIMASDRHARLLAGTAERVITVSKSTVTQLPAADGPTTLTPVHRRNAAYVLFTSGSTGDPKGCVVEHGALASLAHHVDALQIRQDSRVLQFASYAFGISLIEIWCSLAKGAAVCIPSEHDRLNDLVGAVKRMKVNWAFLTPSVVNQITPERVSSLDCLIVAGEPLAKNHVQTWAESVHLMQAYGMSEWAGICSVGPKVGPTTNRRNIGNSINANFWLVEPGNHDKLVPIGAVGELVIEGPCLARCYFNNTEATAAKFISNPPWMRNFRSRGTQARLCKTGDLVRYVDSSGDIEYVGRKDTQVKIRGQRVELGAVEHQVLRNFHNAERVIAEVITPQREKSTPTLIAFVYTAERKTDGRNKENPDSISILVAADKEFQRNGERANAMMRGSLPGYMLPQVYLPLHHVPLTVTGKVDRRRLREIASALSPEVLRSHFLGKVDIVPPITDMEVTLHRVFVEILGIQPDSFGVNDSFFGLGGDSLLAMQLVRRCRDENICLTVEEIFHCKTISRLALCMKDGGMHTIEADEWGVGVAFGLSPAQQLFFYAQRENFNLSVQTSSFRLKRRIDAQQMCTAIKSIAKRHPMLRARFTPTPHVGGWTQAILPNDKGAYTYHSHKLASQKEMAEVIAERQRCLNIESGPVFRADFIEIAGDGQFLYLIAHDLVIDQVSWRIISRGLERSLHTTALPAGKETLSFQTWCRLEAERGYECPIAHQPAGSGVTSKKPMYSELPELRDERHNVLEESFTVDAALASRLLGDANYPFQTEPAEILQAAILHSYVQTFTDRKMPVLVIQKERREASTSAKDVPETVGLLTTLVPVRVAVSRSADVVDLLRRIKDFHRQENERAREVFPLDHLETQAEGVRECEAPVTILFQYLADSQREPKWDGHIMQQLSCSTTRPSVEDGTCHTWLLGVFATVGRDYLTIHFTVCEQNQDQRDLRRWVRACQRFLEQAAGRLQQMDQTFTPGDFTLLRFTDADLENFLDRALPSVGIASSTELEDAYPCSPLQQQILLSQKRDPRLYQMRFIWEIKVADNSQNIDVDRLRNAWLDVVGYHPILRTIFMDNITQDACFVQVLLRKGGMMSVNTVICADVPDDIREGCRRGKEILPRLEIFKIEGRRVLCSLDISHALTDATSMSILRRDLVLAYDKKLILGSSGHRLQYREFISYLQRQPRLAALRYWQGYLLDSGPCMFPRLSDNSEASGMRHEYQSIDIDLTRSSMIHTFCETSGITLSTLLHVSWGLVLRAFTGMDTVIFAYLTSGRDVPLRGIGDALGPFINLMICRLDLADGTTVFQILESAQDGFIRGLQYQHFSLADVLHEMGSPGSGLFNTGVSFPPDTAGMKGERSSIAIREVAREDPSEFDVAVMVIERGKEISVKLKYWTSFMSEKQASDIASTLEASIYAIIEHSQARVEELSIVKQPGQTAVTAELN